MRLVASTVTHTNKNLFLAFYDVQFCTNTLIKVTATSSTRIDNAIENIVIKGKRCEVNNEVKSNGVVIVKNSNCMTW